MRTRAWPSLALGAGLCWVACSTPTYQRPDADLPRLDASGADRQDAKDTSSMAEVSTGDLSTGRPTSR